jgi:hypothetical protein
MQDPSTHKALYAAHTLMSGKKSSLLGKNIDAPEKIWIHTQVDYAKALAAYLMWWE